MKIFIDYVGSRRFAIILLIVTTSVILVANVIPNPLLMSPPEAERFVRERPFLHKMSRQFHVINITKSPFFLAFPFFITLSVAVCTFKRVRSRMRVVHGIQSMDRLSFQYEGKGTGDEIINRLEKKGWGVERREEAGSQLVYCRKGTGGIWGSVTFHAGMIVVVVGGIISMLTIFNGTLQLTEGFEAEPLKAAKGLRPSEVRGFPYKRMTLSTFEARYVQGGNFPLDYTAVIETVARDGTPGREKVKVNQPIDKNGFQFLLDEYYYAPRFVITEKESGRVIEDAYVNLVVRAGAQSDQFNLPEIGVRINAVFFPDFKEDGGTLMTVSMNPDNPVFILEFFKDGQKLGDGILPLHKKMDFDQGRYTIEFKDMREWISLSIAKDYGLPFVKLGLLLIVSGLVVRFFLNEKSIWVAVQREGGERKVRIGGKAAYFPALFDEELRAMVEDFEIRTDMDAGERG